MVFNSYVFLFYFLPFVSIVYFGMRFVPKALFLLIVSYIFYGWWKPEYMVLMLFSTTVDFFAGLLLGKGYSGSTKKWILFGSIFTNVGLLSYFKYFSFGVTVLNDAVNMLGLTLPSFPLAIPEIVLPIGISFYTFQSMSYTFDVYRGDIKPCKRFIDFAAYIAMFPQLVAGPIVRANTILPHIRSPKISSEKVGLAIHFFTLGLAKKLIVADVLGIACSSLHQQETIGFWSSWISIYADVFHWYFDFSGYSDMAIGLGYLLGFSFPQNFNSPLRSSSMTELVVKWHMTLISWFRDYVYIPLGGNRKGSFRTYLNLFLIMFLSGVWHGAGWTFFVWALMMAFALIVERALGISRTRNSKEDWLTTDKRKRFFYPLKVWGVLTYYSLCVSVFTSQDLKGAFTVVKGLVGRTSAPFLPEFMDPYFCFAFITGAAIVFFSKNTWELAKDKLHPVFYILIALLSIGVLLLNKETPFMYFRF